MKTWMLGILLALVATSAVAFNETDLKRFKYTGNCESCDLTNVNFEGAPLDGAEFKSTDLSGANLKNADLRNVQFFNVNLIGADLRGANLTRARLSAVNLTDADLRGANLTKTSFDKVKFCRTKTPWGTDNSTFFCQSEEDLAASKAKDEAERQKRPWRENPVFKKPLPSILR